MLRVKQFEFSLFGVNTYVVVDEATKEAAVIDPAMFDTEEKDRFAKYVDESGIKITQVINTHLHLDHCFGENFVKDTYGVPAKANIDDKPLAEQMAKQYAMFGMKKRASDIVVDAYLAEGDKVQIGQSQLLVIHVPGHSKGGIALYSPSDKLLFVGDSLFKGSIGRTDLMGGNHAQLVGSIRNKLFTLPDDTVVLPGHGPYTTVGYEKKNNPYVG